MAGPTGAGSGYDLGAAGSVRAASGLSGSLIPWLVVILALSGPSLSGFMTTIVAPLGSTIARHFGGGTDGAWVAQMSLTLPGIGVILGGPMAAWLVGRFGYRPVIVAAALLLTVVGTAGAFIEVVPLFLATRLLVGFGAATLYTVLIALSGTIYSGGTLARLLSYQNGASAAVGMGLTLLSGQVAHAFGWRASFFIYLIAAVFIVLPLICWLPSGRKPASIPTEGHTTERASLKPMVPLLLVTIAVFTVVYLVVVQGSLLLSANGVEDPATQALVISGSTLTFFIFASAGSWIDERITGRATFGVGLAAMGVGAIVMGAVPSVPAALVGSLVLGCGSGLTSTWLFRAAVERAGPEIRTRVVGLLGPAHYVGQVANPFIVQGLRSFGGIQGAFMIIGAVLFAAAAVAVLMSRNAPQGAAAS